ncbi:MAG: response regulator [Bacteroidota bacterium]
MPQNLISSDNSTLGINNKLILIAEDDLDDQELLKEIFASIDDSFLLLFADNGSQVMTLLDESDDKNLPCLIILDYNMPGSNGAEILKELKPNSRYNAIPKIIWSTSKSPHTRIYVLNWVPVFILSSHLM